MKPFRNVSYKVADCVFLRKESVLEKARKGKGRIVTYYQDFTLNQRQEDRSVETPLDSNIWAFQYYFKVEVKERESVSYETVNFSDRCLKNDTNTNRSQYCWRKIKICILHRLCIPLKATVYHCSDTPKLTHLHIQTPGVYPL